MAEFPANLRIRFYEMFMCKNKLLNSRIIFIKISKFWITVNSWKNHSTFEKSTAKIVYSSVLQKCENVWRNLAKNIDFGAVQKRGAFCRSRQELSNECFLFITAVYLLFSVHLQTSASIQPRAGLSKFAKRLANDQKKVRTNICFFHGDGLGAGAAGVARGRTGSRQGGLRPAHRLGGHRGGLPRRPAAPVASARELLHDSPCLCLF